MVPVEFEIEPEEALGSRAVDLVDPLAHPRLLVENSPVEAEEFDVGHLAWKKGTFLSSAQLIFGHKSTQ